MNRSAYTASIFLVSLILLLQNNHCVLRMFSIRAIFFLLAWSKSVRITISILQVVWLISPTDSKMTFSKSSWWESTWFHLHGSLNLLFLNIKLEMKKKAAFVFHMSISSLTFFSLGHSFSLLNALLFYHFKMLWLECRIKCDNFF